MKSTKIQTKRAFPTRLLKATLLILWKLTALPFQRRKSFLSFDDRISKKTTERKNDEHSERVNLLDSISKAYDFETGKHTAIKTYASIEELLKKSNEADELRRRMKLPIPSRPFEKLSDDDLWEMVGGKSKETELHLINIMHDEDKKSSNYAAECIISIRSETVPHLNPISYVKASAELAARIRVDQKISKGILPYKAREKFIRPYERQARWIMIRNMQPERR